MLRKAGIMKKPIVLILVLCVSTFSAWAQTDSLFNVLEEAENEVRVNVLNELYKELRNAQPEKALSYAQEALQLAEKIDYPRGQANALNNLGVYHRNRGNYELAIDYYVRALKMHESIENTDGIALTMGNIGNLYSLKGDYDKALEYYNKTLNLIEANPDTVRLISIYNNIGNVYFDLGNNLMAIDYYLRSLALYEKSNHPENTFDLLNSLGNIYFSQRNMDSAMWYFQQSLRVEQINGNKYAQALALNNIGVVHKSVGNYSAAIENQFKARALALEVGNRPLLSTIYKNLSESFYLQKNTAKAYEYLQQYMMLKERLSSEETGRKLAELESSYELAKREKEIEILQQEGEIKDLNVRNSNLLISVFTMGGGLLTALLILYYLKFQHNQRVKNLLEERNREIMRRNREIEAQKQIIEFKNQNITDSIQYAKSIQETILKKRLFRYNMPDSFIFNRPKDIVSGDFFWYARIDDFDILALIDCTGHGVAGAFMTVIGNSILNQIIHENKVYSPSQILLDMDERLAETLKQLEESSTHYGMDLAVCKIDRQHHKLIFSGAKRPLYYVHQGEFTEFKGDNLSIGELSFGRDKSFQEYEINYKEGDVFYIFSDGFADQFGSAVDKKYMSKRFRQLIRTIQKQSMEKQGQSLELEMNRWMGSTEQTDDMLVIGFKL
ncbi:tetratricopeptide repeat protein [Cytophagales bacterium LB-30]|uniref:Tetratricopeptide repeat protein n=2 Tax=Shiella aurantiaca TaxID=3058365 RepID=A0ABT8F1X5_9BACT|nr:tetratricopeptide repeat protein [Shiella aurantiaca]